MVPFVEKARVPAAATFLLHAGLAALVAFGVDALRSAKESPEANLQWFRRINIGVAAFGIAGGMVVMAVLIARRYQWDFDDRVVVTVFVALLMAVLLYAWRTHSLTRRQAVILLTLLLLFEVGNESGLALADRNQAGPQLPG